MRPPRRVLVVEPYGIGDLLFLTPVLRALRLLASVEKVDLLLGSRTESVVRANPHVDEIFVIDKDLFHRQVGLQTFRDLVHITRDLRRRRYDLLLDYSFRREYGFWSQFFLGIPRRAGFDSKGRGIFLTHRLAIPHGFTGQHAVDFFAGVAELAGVPVEDRHLEFYLTSEERAEASRFLESRGASKYLVISPGGGQSWGKDAHFKRWPPRSFAGFVEKFKDSFDKIFILAGPDEKKLADELVSFMGASCENLAGRLSIPQAAAVIERASLFVGNDGGLMHIAHALRVPLIGIFGPVDTAVYGPYPARPGAVAVFKEGLECRPCYQNFRYQSDCPHRNCLQALTPDEVYDFLHPFPFDFFSAPKPCGRN